MLRANLHRRSLWIARQTEKVLLNQPTTLQAMLVAKIISGGQTGVERGALEAAFESGFPYGGMIPKGRAAADGIVPEKYDRLKVAVRKDYPFRNEFNVGHSDATLIIAREKWEDDKRYDSKEIEEERIGGTKKTVDFCRKHNRPFLVLFSANLPKVLDWLHSLGKEDILLNIDGPRESRAKGIQESTKKFVVRLIDAVREEGKGDDV